MDQNESVKIIKKEKDMLQQMSEQWKTIVRKLRNKMDTQKKYTTLISLKCLVRTTSVILRGSLPSLKAGKRKHREWLHYVKRNLL